MAIPMNRETPEHYRLAASQLGFDENQQNAALSEYLKNGGQNLDPKVTAWCAGFVNASINQTGGKGTGSLAARSFMDWGQPVETPQVGDVAVFSRPKGGPNAGHVGFYAGPGPEGKIRVLGGNQGDAVSYAHYPQERLLGYRRAPDAVVASQSSEKPPADIVEKEIDWAGIADSLLQDETVTRGIGQLFGGGGGGVASVPSIPSAPVGQAPGPLQGVPLEFMLPLQELFG